MNAQSHGGAALAMSNAKQTRVCGNRMCGQAFVAGPRYKSSWCLPCKNWLARHGDIRNTIWELKPCQTNQCPR